MQVAETQFCFQVGRSQPRALHRRATGWPRRFTEQLPRHGMMEVGKGWREFKINEEFERQQAGHRVVIRASNGKLRRMWIHFLMAQEIMVRRDLEKPKTPHKHLYLSSLCSVASKGSSAL